MNTFRSALHNPVAHASFVAGVLLCLLTAFVFTALDSRNAEPDGVLESTGLLYASSSTVPGAGTIRDSAFGLATDRVETLSSWQPVLRWASSASAPDEAPDVLPAGSGRLNPVTQLAAPPVKIDGSSSEPDDQMP